MNDSAFMQSGSTTPRWGDRSLHASLQQGVVETPREFAPFDWFVVAEPQAFERACWTERVVLALSYTPDFTPTFEYVEAYSVSTDQPALTALEPALPSFGYTTPIVIDWTTTDVAAILYQHYAAGPYPAELEVRFTKGAPLFRAASLSHFEAGDS